MKRPDDQPLFTIRTASRILGISAQMLAHYEREGLIISCRNKSTKKKFYSFDDIERVRAIRNLIYINRLSIEGIKTLLALIPCWKIKKCLGDDRKECRFISSHNEPCWMMKNKSPDCADKDCRNCPVYELLPGCSHLKDFIFD